MDSGSGLNLVITGTDQLSVILQAISDQLKEMAGVVDDVSAQIDTAFGTADKSAATLGDTVTTASAKSAESLKTVSVASDTTSASLEKTSTSAKASSSGFMGMNTGALVAAAGVAYLADKTVKAASNFQSMGTALVTGAGESQKNLQMVQNGILAVADSTGSTTTNLENGMYLIESAGYHGAQGLDVLKVAAEGAKVGNADLQTTAGALTTVMHDYGITANNSGQAMNFLVSTVANGKMHMDDLTGSLGKILPTASQLHVPLAQVGGAMASLTVAGIPATRAATALNETMLKFVAPTKAAVTALAEVGLSSTDLGTTLTTKGLMPAIQQLTEAVGNKFPVGSAKYLASLSTITGGVRGLTGVLGTSGNSMLTFIQNSDKISAATQRAGTNVIGWSQVQKDAKQQMDQFKASIETAGIAIGSALLPALTSLASTIANTLKPIAEFVEGHKQLSTEVILVAGGILTLVTVSALATKTWKAMEGGLTTLRAGLDGLLNILGPLAAKLGLVDAESQLGSGKLGMFGGAARSAATEAEGAAASIGGESTGLVGAIGAINPAVALAGIAIVGGTTLMVTHWSAVKRGVDDAIGSIKSFLGISNTNSPALTSSQSQRGASGLAPTEKGEQQNQTALLKILATQTQALSSAKNSLASSTNALNKAVETEMSDYSKYGPNNKQVQKDIATVTSLSSSQADAQAKVNAIQSEVADTQSKLNDNTASLSKTQGGLLTLINQIPNAQNQVKQAHNQVSDATTNLNNRQKDLGASYTLFKGTVGPGAVSAHQQIGKAADSLASSSSNLKDKTDGLNTSHQNLSTAMQTAKYWTDQQDQKVKALGLDAKTTKGYIDSLNGSLSNSNSAASGGSFWSKLISHFATGVTNFQGGLAIVGEQGPELVNLPSGSSVIPNGQTSQLLKNSNSFSPVNTGSSGVGNSSGPVNITINTQALMGNASEAQQFATTIWQNLMAIARQHGNADALPGIGVRPA